MVRGIKVFKTYPIPNKVTFDELQIGDIFTTDVGQWRVFDKGSATLVADKVINGNPLEHDNELIVFFDYEFEL